MIGNDKFFERKKMLNSKVSADSFTSGKSRGLLNEVLSQPKTVVPLNPVYLRIGDKRTEFPEKSLGYGEFVV